MLSASLFTGGSLLFGVEPFAAALRSSEARRELLQAANSDFAGGKMIGTAPFLGESDTIMDAPFNSELDGREYTTHSNMSVEGMLDMVTPTDKFYIRTRASKRLNLTKPWVIRVGTAAGLAGDTSGDPLAIAPSTLPAGTLSAVDLQREAEPMGLHLMECAGNGVAAHFGMLSVADWSGVRLTKIADKLGIKGSSSRVLVSGFDDYTATSRTSVAGASWIFPWNDLVSTGAFLATKINGQPLPLDHGSPVRLLVPGWYGCCCIKWVNEISVVGVDADATSQMKEYASRTHQKGVPEVAKEYQPAEIDPVGTPIRVEKWMVGGKIRYRVVGLIWGEHTPLRNWEVQFIPSDKAFPMNPNEGWVPLEKIYETTADTWKLWTQTWNPQHPGDYVIRLQVNDPNVRTRRLDMGFYGRTVQITEV